MKLLATGPEAGSVSASEFVDVSVSVSGCWDIVGGEFLAGLLGLEDPSSWAAPQLCNSGSASPTVEVRRLTIVVGTPVGTAANCSFPSTVGALEEEDGTSDASFTAIAEAGSDWVAVVAESRTPAPVLTVG